MTAEPRPLTFDCGDVTLAADGFGDPDASPVLLFHGGGQTRHSWDRTAAQLGNSGWFAVNVDLRGHGESTWSPDGVYSIDRFAGDARAVAETFAGKPALVGASLGGLSSLLAAGESDGSLASALILVDVAPRMEPTGVLRIRDFMQSGMSGFASLDEVADAIAAYNPHRQRPKDLSGLSKNLRLRDDGRWYWHWDPRFMTPPDETAALDGLPVNRFAPSVRLEAAAQRLAIPTLLVRGGSSDLLSEEGARELLALVPHAEFVDVAGAGHMVAGDRNDRFNAAVVSFLESVRTD